MMHFSVRTLTLNPSIDVSSEAEKVEPERKIRTCCERIDPGGGGINVARVLARLGTSVEAVYLAGGATGDAFDALLEREGLARCRVPIADDTRTSLTVHEHSRGREFRFVPEGPTVSPEELKACRSAVAAERSDYLVASGSLPPGVPNDFYADLCAASEARFVLDTSGDELRAALERGRLFLVKVSGEEMDRDAALEAVRHEQAKLVTLTLGGEGALLIAADGTWSLPSFEVPTVSTVGAGDSFLAGMTCGLARGLDRLEAFRLAVASGAAATLSPGTDLAHAADVERLLPRVGQPQRVD